MAVARALRIEVSALLGEEEGAGAVASRGEACLPELRRVVTAYDCPPDPGRPVRPLPELARDVARAGHLRLQCQYGALGEMVVPLLEELSVAADVLAGHDREVAFWLLSIDRVRWAAERSGDELMLATAAYVRAETFFVSGPVESGLRILGAAAEAIANRTLTDTEAASVYGALHSRAAVLAAFGRKPEQAWAYLEVARVMAESAGAEVSYFHTGFGPATLKVHEVAIAVELRDADEAVRRARGWVPPRLGSCGRAWSTNWCSGEFR